MEWRQQSLLSNLVSTLANDTRNMDEFEKSAHVSRLVGKIGMKYLLPKLEERQQCEISIAQ